MVYCQSCGKQNADDARFCDGCGAPLAGYHMPPSKRREEQCEEECSGRTRRGSILWGVIIIAVGIVALLEWGIKNIPGTPQWFIDIPIWWIIPILIGVALIAAGARIVMDKSKPQ